jgi:hypothetical protein
MQRRLLRRIALIHPSHAASHLLGVRVNACATDAAQDATVSVLPLLGDPRILAGA